MLQRIQSLYLTGALVIMLLFLFMPFGTFSTLKEEMFYLYHHGLVKITLTGKLSIYENYSLSILTSLFLIITFLCIFSYKNRLFQIKLCSVNVFILVIIAGAVIWQFLQTSKSFDHTTLKWSFFAPFISIVLTLLARRNIRKDEELVRSADRLR